MFAKILIPIPISQLFTYKVPFFLENKINIGHRAIIPLGNRKIQTGIVLFLEKTQPAEIDTKEIKEIIDVPDEYPIFLTPQIKLLEQIAQYYLCTLGEVLHTALPSGFKINSKSIIQINPEIDIYELESYNFNDLETKLIDILALKESISYDELDAQIGIKNPYKTIHSLIDKKIIFLFEQITEKYKPDTLKKIRLSPDYQAKEQITALFEKLKKKEPQTDILLFYVQEIMPHISVENNKKGMKKSKIEEKKLSKAALNTLLKNKIMEEFTEVVSRFPFIEKEQTEIILQDIQQQKLNEIVTAFESKNVVLFHGITGSGKTEIYIHLIQKEIATGKQVLYLLPELALTVQIVQRIRAFFGDIVGIYHSRFSAKEKVEVWKEIINGRFKIIVGTRSSIFLPFHSLSLIIVDEEHDASFKQTEASPHYNARDMAIFLAQEHTAKVLLGSATPSLESFFNAENKKYGLVTLHERFAQATLPTINLINVREEKKNKKMNGRAGRKSQSGQVYIQTYNPQLHLFQQIKNNDYQNFYKKEIIQRKIYRFPPIVRLIKISFLHTIYMILKRVCPVVG